LLSNTTICKHIVNASPASNCLVEYIDLAFPACYVSNEIIPVVFAQSCILERFFDFVVTIWITSMDVDLDTGAILETASQTQNGYNTLEIIAS
jgi:hypothetical protein